MRIIHRPHNAELVYGLTLVETDEDGTDTVVPPELICRVKPTMLKDETLEWVSVDENKRLYDILQESYYETMDAGATDPNDILKAAADEGYDKVATIFESPDPGFLDHHVLCRNQVGQHVDLIFQHEEYYGEYTLIDLTTRNHDMQGETLLLYLMDPADIDLARDAGVICLDDNGYHTQVCLYQSARWQCQGNEGLDQGRLRRFWSRAVQNERSSNLSR